MKRAINTARYQRVNIDADVEHIDTSVDTDSNVSLGYNKTTVNNKVFSWNKIEYIVNGKKILHGISGHIMQGELVGILGHSGAGKTSLLHALSGRRTNGELCGEIHHNGRQVNNIMKLKELCGYVSQTNILHPTSTAKECIEFSANLRLPPHVTQKQKQQTIESVISALQLSHCCDTIVGTEFKQGLSGGEAKRVSIGVELVTNPQLLVLDEPVSGLDSYTALKTMKILKTLTRTYNKQLMLSIHQPSPEMFGMFDKLVLMAKGHCVYFGCSSKVKHYFKLLGYHHPPDMMNFANFILHSIQDDPDFFISAWKKFKFDPVAGFTDEHNLSSSAMNEQTPRSDRSLLNTVEASVIKRETYCNWYNFPKAPFWKQVYYLMERDLVGIYRDPFHVVMNIINFLIVGILLGTIYWDVPLTMRGTQDLTSCLFFICTHGLMTGIMNSLKMFTKHRILYEHERSSKTYSTAAYLLCECIHSTTFVLIDAVLMSFLTSYAVFHSLWNYHLWTQFGLVMFLGGCASGASGVLIGCFTKGFTQAMSSTPIFTPMVLFNNVTADMTHITSWFVWFKKLNFISYAIDALFEVAFIGRDITMPLAHVSGEQYLDFLGVGGQSSFNYNIAMLCGFIFVFWFITWIILVKRNGF